MDDLNAKLDELKASGEQVFNDKELSAQERVTKLQEIKDQIQEVETEIQAAKLHEEVTAEADQEPEADADADAGEETSEDAQPEADASEEDAATEEQPEADAAGDSEQADQPAAEGEPEVEENHVEEAIAASSVKDAPEADAGTQPYRSALVASSAMEGLAPGAGVELHQFQKVHQSALRASGDSRQTFGGFRLFDSGGESLREENGAFRNTQLLHAGGIQDMGAITAAACFCGPDEAVKEIAAIGDDARPVQGVFNTVPVSGRFNYLKSLGIADVATGTTIWECADQEGIDPADPATFKPCVDLDCQADVTVEPYTVPACGLISKHTQLSNGQLVDNFIRTLGVAHSRTAEVKLLDELVAASRVFDVDAGALGTASLLNTVEFIGSQLIAPAFYANRVTRDGYIALVPLGTLEAIVADQHLRGGGQEAASRADILQSIQESLGVDRVEVILDVHTAAQAAYTSAVAALPAVGTPTAWVQGTNNVASHPVYILRPDSFRAGMGEVVEAGFQTDSELTRRNQVQYFAESIEFLEKIGSEESFVLNVTGCPSGVATAPAAAPACVPAP